MDFLKSKPVRDFVDKGKLPTVDCNVTIESKSIVNLVVCIFIMIVLILLAYNVIKGLK